jgi:flagellar hook-length control protein FliK
MARSLLIETGKSIPEASLLSVTPEAAANAAFQAAPHWSRGTAQQQAARDPFGTLVNETAASLPPPPAPPAAPPRRTDETPPSANSAPAPAYDANNQPAGNDQSGNAGAAPPTNTSAGASTNANGGSPSGAANQASATTSGTSDGGSDKPVDKQSETDTSNPDSTTLAQQTALNATTPIPLAAAIAVATPTTDTSAATPSSGGSTPPLAIAAAALAASAQTLSGQPGTPTQDKTDATASPSTTSKTAAVAPKTAPGTTADVQPTTLANVPALGAVAATPPVTAKATPTAKASAATAPSDSTTTETTPGSTDPAETLQNGQGQPGPTGAKPEQANVAVQAPTGDPAASPTPAVTGRDHSPAAGAAHVLADSPDTGTQAVATFQPHLNSPASATSSGALTVTASANGPVPLNGLALEIASSVKSGKSRFEIRLDPAELGRIDVRIDVDRNGQVTSHLTVERPETLSLLRQDSSQLQRALDDAGLKTASGGLQFSLRDQSSSGQNSGNDFSSNAHRLVISEEDATPVATAERSYGRPLGSRSGVDIRV